MSREQNAGKKSAATPGEEGPVLKAYKQLVRSLLIGKAVEVKAAAVELNSVIDDNDKTLRVDHPLYWEARSGVMEARDFLGQEIGTSLWTSPDGSELMANLKSAHRTHKGSTDPLQRAKLRYCLFWIQERIYHEENYSVAREAFRELINHIRRLDPDDKRPPSSPRPVDRPILPRALWYLSRAHLHLGQFSDAEELLAEILDFYCNWQKAARGSEEVMFADYARRNIAVSIAGLAWNRLQAGNLQRAKRYAQVALVFLEGSHDVLSLAWARLVYGATCRITADRDNDDLNTAITYLIDACRVFEDVGHRGNTARTAFELSHAYLIQDKIPEARVRSAQLEKLISDATKPGGESRRLIGKGKWPFNKRLLDARIHLKDRAHEAAIKECNDTIDLIGETSDFKEFKIKALIERNRVNSELNTPDSRDMALDDIREAFELLPRNKEGEPEETRLAAMVYTRMADSIIASRDENEIEMDRNKVGQDVWKSLGKAFVMSRNLEDSVLESEVREVTKSALSSVPFAIPGDYDVVRAGKETSPHDYWRERLVIFLFNQAWRQREARGEVPTQELVSSDIGLSVTSVREIFKTAKVPMPERQSRSKKKTEKTIE